jgi:hypothetical protein
MLTVESPARLEQPFFFGGGVRWGLVQKQLHPFQVHVNVRYQLNLWYFPVLQRFDLGRIGHTQ